VQLFGALLVHTGETLARCFDRKRFVEFQVFLRMLFGSVWCRRIRSLHLILDNGSTHGPQRLPAWIRTLDLPFSVRLHWLPVNASWLDQIEIVFSELQRKVLTPNDFSSTHQVRRSILELLRRAQPTRSTDPMDLHLPKAHGEIPSSAEGWPPSAKNPERIHDPVYLAAGLRAGEPGPARRAARMERQFDLVVVGTGVTSSVASRCREARWSHRRPRSWKGSPRRIGNAL
jgi:hypothetical protein